MSEGSKTSAAPRRRRWLRVFAYFLLALLVILPLQFFMRLHIGKRNLDDAIAETDAIDPDWRFERLLAIRKAIPLEEDAAAVIFQAANAVDEKTFGASFFDQIGELSIEKRPTLKQADALKVFVTKNAKALEIARRLRHLPEGRYEFEFDFSGRIALTGLWKPRMAATLLDYDVAYQLHTGNTAQAASSALALLHVGSAGREEPLTLLHLVRSAIQDIAVRSMERVLAQTEVSQELLQEWQKALLAESPRDTVVLCARTSRATTFKVIEYIRSGKLRPDARFGEDLDWNWSIWWGFLRSPEVYANEEARILLLMNDLVAAASLSARRRPHMAVQYPDPGPLGHCEELLQIPVRALDRNEALFLCASAAIAAERFRMSRKRWPASLQELVEDKLLAEVPIDPYDGKPLRLRRTDNGLVIYSVYENKVDNGGRSIRLENPSELPIGVEQDLGFQLWDPPTRAAPPLPVEPPKKEVDE